MKRLLLSLGTALALQACQPAPVTTTTFNFNRPAGVALVCLQVQLQADGRSIAGTMATPLPLDDARCQNTLAITGEQTAGTVATRLFALVTQSDRGEVAVVDLHSNTTQRIIDNNRAVPGFTFIPVGAFPVALAVHPSGRFTFVANTGESTVTVLDNSTLLTTGPHRVRSAMGTGFVTLDVGHPPRDVAIASRGDRVMLYVSVPDESAVRVFDVTDPSAPVEQPMAGLVVRGSGIDGGTGGLDAGAGEGGFGAMARPDDLAVADDGAVYVADRAAPVVHVLRHGGDQGALREVDQLEPGVPTDALAVTPRIEPSGKRFVYAVSAVDHTLLVLDTDTAAARGPLNVNLIADRPECQGQAFRDRPFLCPKVDPKLPFDRVPLAAPVKTLTMVARRGEGSPCGPVGELAITCGCPGASATGCFAPPMGQEPGVRTLRGVQAVVALRTGALQVIDVADPESTCSTRAPTYFSDEEEQVPFVRAFQPHLPRSATTSRPTLTAEPLVSISGMSNAVSTATPHLVPVPRARNCGTGEACCARNNFCVGLPVAPGSTSTDPLAVRDDTWTLTYEGALPGLTRSDGAFRAMTDPLEPPERLHFDVPGAQFCARGALAGDRLVLVTTSPRVQDSGMDAGIPIPPDPVCSTDLCLGTFGNSVRPCNRELVIEAARDNELVVSLVPTTPGGTQFGEACTEGGPVSAEEMARRLRCCYPQATRFEVRTAGVWTVVGRRAGYQHNVVSAGGTCVPDPQRLPTGRLVEDDGVGSPEVYVSQAFTLRLAPGERRDGTTVVRVPTARGTTLQFTTTGGYAPFIQDAVPTPVAIEYSCTSQRLYLVDQGRSSLQEYEVAPLASMPRQFN